MTLKSDTPKVIVNSPIDLVNIPTKDLIKELEKREGITTINVQPYEKIEVGGIVVDGPAIISIKKD